MKIGIVSLRVSIGQFSHFLAFKEMLENNGHKVCLIIHEGYRRFCENEPLLRNSEIIYIASRTDLSNIVVDAALFYNISPMDVYAIKAMKHNNPKAKVLYTYHEPWYGLNVWMKDIIEHRVKVIVPIKNIAIHFLAIRALRICDMVVLPSNTAKEIYNRYDVKYNRNIAIFPLIYRDEAKDQPIHNDQRYFSFIATADMEKNFPLFLQCILEFFKRDSKFKAQIVTKADISSFWLPELDPYKKEGRLIVQSGRLLENSEINAALTKSYCTWLYYHHSTQSGVLARAFMLSSPVLASTSGCFCDYVNGKNGIVISETLDSKDAIEEIWKAQRIISDNLSAMRVEARNTFDQSFSYHAFSDEFEKLIKN